MASLKIDIGGKKEDITTVKKPNSQPTSKLARNNNFLKRTVGIKSANPKKLDLNIPKKKKKPWYFFVLIGLLVIGILGGGAYFIFFRSNTASAKDEEKGGFNKTVEEFILPSFEQDENGYTNVLLVGKDTREHSQGLQNTDTVMIASYNDKNKEVVLISIPRDMWVKYPIDIPYYRRVNGVYAYGQKKGDKGIDMLKEVTKDVTGLDIHYWGVVDLGGFKKAVDQVGGIDVKVENAFTDYNFPNESGGGRYRTISFEEGVQHMDGATALDFARSRKGTNGEGSDFARARRQQVVMKAFAEKAVNIENLNVETVLDLKKTFNDSVQYSPVGIPEIRAGLAKVDDFDPDKITSIVLDPALNGGSLIVRADPSLTAGAYAIWPAKGLDKWEDVHTFLKGVISDPTLFREEASVYVYAGGHAYSDTNTEAKKLASKFSMLEVIFAGYNNSDDVEGIIVLVNEEKPETLRRIKEELEKTNSDLPVSIVRELNGFRPRFGESISIIFGNVPAPELESTTETNSETPN